MKVMLFVKATKNSEAGTPPSEEAILAVHKWNEELEKAGVLIEAGGLTPSNRGARIKFKGGRRTVIDGPFTETKELVAGYSIIQVKTLAEAIEWAKRAPVDVGLPDGEELEVELRPLFDPSEFDPKE